MKAKLKITRAGTFVVPVCVECDKELNADEIGYGHDCEVSPSPAVEHYNYEADKCSCTTNYMCRTCVYGHN